MSLTVAAPPQGRVKTRAELCASAIANINAAVDAATKDASLLQNGRLARLRSALDAIEETGDMRRVPAPAREHRRTIRAKLHELIKAEESFAKEADVAIAAIVDYLKTDIPASKAV